MTMQSRNMIAGRYLKFVIVKPEFNMPKPETIQYRPR